jgi:chorismate mutase/prephenate dehydrogenase
MSDLDALREQVDAIDRALIVLLATRRSTVDAIAELKRRNSLDAVDPTREAALRALWSREAELHGLPVEAALAVLAGVLEGSRKHVSARVASDTDGARG